MGIAETIALSMGIAWASGINLYATLATLGILGATGHMVLPEELHILQDPSVIAAAGFMYMVEFFAEHGYCFACSRRLGRCACANITH